MNRSMPARFVPHLQWLDDRIVPAGGLTATVSNVNGWDTLTIAGDAADNRVMLVGTGTPGSVAVIGLGTTVNGGNTAVVFDGLEGLKVDVADGDDTVLGLGVAVSEINIYAGGGDDRVNLFGTSGSPVESGADALFLWIQADDSQLSPSTAHGDDTILVAGTHVHGQALAIFVDADAYGVANGGRDSVALLDTTFIVEHPELNNSFSIVVYGGYATEPGWGDDILIDGLTVTRNGPGDASGSILISASSGEDRIRLRNVDISNRGDGFAYFDFAVFSDGDSIEVANFKATSETPPGDGFDQVGMTLIGADVRVRNVYLSGGTETTYFGEFAYSSVFLDITALHADVRNVTLTTEFGIAVFTVSAVYPEFGTHDVAFVVQNVTVSGLSYSSINTFGGNDHVEIKNCSFGSLWVDLGDGDDDLVLENNSFVDAVVIGGEGFDGLQLKHNTGLLIDDGFES